MCANEYKTVIRLLRDICRDAMDIQSNFRLSDCDISSILGKEKIIEEILTANFCNVQPLTDDEIDPFENEEIEK